MSSSPPSTSASSSSAPATSILLPSPSGPQEGITPQPAAVDELAIQVRKTRLTGPEIVQLPPDGGYASDNDTDAESEASIGEDGEPKARDMLKDLPDETDDLELTHLQLVNSSLPPLHLPRFGSHLKRLCLRQNRLTSLDPQVFEALTELEELDFYDNRIGYLEGFEKLTKLTSLDFSYNLLRTLLPNGPDSPPLDNLPNLHTVYFIQNKISRIEGLDGLADSLRSLELGGNRIREIKGLEKLVNLEELWLGKNKIRKLENISTLTKLKILSIQSNRITKFENLSNLSSLEEIYISHNGLDSLLGLEGNTNLRVVDIGNNKIEKIEGLTTLPLLEEFWANHNLIPNVAQLSHLEKHANLETVYMEGNPCETNDRSGYRRKVIINLPQLKQVDATFVR